MILRKCRISFAWTIVTVVGCITPQRKWFDTDRARARNGAPPFSPHDLLCLFYLGFFFSVERQSCRSRHCSA